MPDLAHLNVGQIAGYFVPLAALVFLAGVVRAIGTGTVLWTYLGDWLLKWLAPVFVILGLAIVGNGVPSLLIEPNPAVQLIFIPAGLAYIAAALASIAKNVGVDLSTLPFARNVRDVFADSSVKAPDNTTPPEGPQ